MPAADDFLTNVETAWLTVIQNSAVLAAYNWERWDCDTEAKLPRGRLNLSARTSPDETPYQRVHTEFVLEGRPKRHKFSVVMNELKTLLEELNNIDLMGACNNTVKFFGRAENVSEDRKVNGGLRVWTLTFDLFAMPML